ncbi:MAG TPA: hypothetical protein VHP58_04835 [Alphaproteobacteria bacterium]|nr:hypothetical protein [Alphaproteobacteria bacterium]
MSKELSREAQRALQGALDRLKVARHNDQGVTDLADQLERMCKPHGITLERLGTSDFEVRKLDQLGHYNAALSWLEALRKLPDGSALYKLVRHARQVRYHLEKAGLKPADIKATERELNPEPK